MVYIPNVLVTIIGLIILWIISSIPAYIAGKVVTGGKAGLGDAMAATLGGVIVYAIVLFGVTFFLQPFVGASSGIWALILAFVSWLAVYRASFDTSWLGALGIAILALLVFFVLNAVLGSILGVTFPGLFPYPL